MHRDIKAHISKCTKCLQWNSKKQKRAPSQPLPVISTPWEMVASDVVGPLPRTKMGNRYILTIQDFGKHCHRYQNYLQKARGMLCQIKKLLTDNGSNFIAKVTKKMLTENGITHLSGQAPIIPNLTACWRGCTMFLRQC